jgi:REP element-mobilizing transposase RayT
VFTQRRLPHWHPQDKPVFLTWHLKGSLPHHRYPPPGALSAGKAFVWTDRFLDQMQGGPLWLRSEILADMVVDAIHFGEQTLGHYELGAYVVMPNHVHVLVTPRVPVPELMRRLKGYTAREANRILNRTGEAFWQGESYDHGVRNSEEWGRIAAYIERNPVTAGLAARPEDYRWSSAAMGEAGHRQDCRCGRPGGPLHDEGFQASEM